MHDHVAVVQQHPPRVTLTLGVQRLSPELLEHFLAQVFEDGGCLPVTARGADHEVVGNQRDAADIEQDNVAGELVRDQVDDTSRETKRFGRFDSCVGDGSGCFPCQLGVLPPRL